MKSVLWLTMDCMGWTSVSPQVMRLFFLTSLWSKCVWGEHKHLIQQQPKQLKSNYAAHFSVNVFRMFLSMPQDLWDSRQWSIISASAKSTATVHGEGWTVVSDTTLLTVRSSVLRTFPHTIVIVCPLQSRNISHWYSCSLFIDWSKYSERENSNKLKRNKSIWRTQDALNKWKQRQHYRNTIK
jgi:hypothetical protein